MRLERPVREWSSDSSLAVMLVSLFILLFAALPMEAADELALAGRTLSVVCFTALGLALAAAITNTRRERIVGFGAALVPAVLAWIQLFRPNAGLATLRSAMALAFMAGLTAVALRMVVRPGPVTRRQIAGAVAVYLMVALVFGEAYWLLQHLDPHAISFANAPAAHEALRADFVYFSIASLTTLGFGDVLPISTAARVIVTMEALFGQLYLVLLVSRLVSTPLPTNE